MGGGWVRGRDGWVGKGEGVCVRVGRGWGMDGWPSSRLGGWWWCLRIESWDLKLPKKEIVCDFVLALFPFFFFVCVEDLAISLCS